MTVRLRVLGFALIALLLAAPKAHASTIILAFLTNSQENPPTVPTLVGGAPRPESFGTATFVLNDAMTAMTMVATIFNIDVTGTQTADVNDNLIAAHIHGGPNVPPANNGVVWGFFGTPFNDTVNPALSGFTPFATGVGGTFFAQWDLAEGNGGTNLQAQLPNIFAGRAYINFHTTQFGGGEIRGALLTPEPGTWLLLGSGLALIARRRFARR